MQRYLVRAIPGLIALLSDHTRLELQPRIGSNPTTPADEASCALVRIGRPSVPPLIAALDSQPVEIAGDTLLLGWPDSVLHPWRAGALGALQAMTGESLPAEAGAWRAWWNLHAAEQLPIEATGVRRFLIFAGSVLALTMAMVAGREWLKRRRASP
jgi:hypothetical protein